MSSNKKITMRQLQILIILSAMGTGVIVLPRRAADFLPEGAQDGWVIAIGLTLIAIVVGILISAAARAAQSAAEYTLSENLNETKSPQDLSFIDSVSILLTKPFAYVLGIIMWAKLVIAAGLELRIFLEISRDIMLPNTPAYVISAVMIGACAYAAAKGLETRARVAEVLFALLILPILFLFTIAVLDADFTNLQPVLVNDVHSLVRGSVRLGFILTGLECLLLVSAYVPREKSLGRAVVGALGVAGVLIICITVITIASFGSGLSNEPWPVIGMMDVINLPGSFIERQEALMFGFWIVTAFALGNAMLFFGGLLVTDIFKKAKLSTGVILSALGVFGVSILPIDRETVYAQMDFMYATTGIFFLVVLPIALLIAAKITIWGRNKILAKTIAFMIFLAFAITLLVGCWDSTEIENRAFVVAMGVDKSEENYSVTLSIPIMDEDGKDEDEDEEIPAHIKTSEGQTITEALKKLDAKNDKNLYYGQTKLIILGTNLLESEEFLRGTLNTITNAMKSPRRIHVLAAEDPSKILSTKPPAEILPGSYVGDIYRDKNKIGGHAFALDFERLSSMSDAIIPKIERNDDELRLSGAVVLKKSCKTGIISPEELQGLLWCFPRGNTGAVVTAENISMKIEKHKTNISFHPGETDSPLRAVIEIKATGTVDEISETAQESVEMREHLENIFTAAIKKEISATAELLQNEHGVDGYNLLEHLRKKNYPLYKQYADNWHEIFPKIEIVPQVTVVV
ncbi:MAG: Ger(x)C family spore germination protein [Defluviitaleaceae bacterium]|nr:Ger(x)C family spore germination protein [Defluviitaleaceae bacterium]